METDNAWILELNVGFEAEITCISAFEFEVANPCQHKYKPFTVYMCVCVYIYIYRERDIVVSVTEMR